MEKNLKGYKGFEKGLICRGKQYAENTVFEEEDAVVCRKGMHFCVNPFDVLDHYGLVNEDGGFNDFAGFIKACVNFVIERTTFEEPKIGSSGDSAVVMCAGNGSIAKAKKGSWITLAEWKENAEGKWIPVNVVTVQVDGEKIKEDTYYKLENGEFVEVGE